MIRQTALRRLRRMDHEAHAGELRPHRAARAVESIAVPFEVHPQPMWVYDLKTLRILAVNDAAVAHYGYSRAEFLALALPDLRPPEEVDRLLDEVRGGLPPLGPVGEWRHRCKDGRVIDVQIQAHTVAFDGRAARLVVATDITARKEAEARVVRHLAQLSSLRSIDQAIIASTDLATSLAMILAQVTTQLGVDAALVLTLDPHLHILEYAASRGFRGAGVRRLRLRLGEGHAGRAALERRAIRVDDLAREPLGQAALVAEEGFVSYRALPLVAKGEVKGVLSLLHRTPLVPDEAWEEFLEALAGQTAIAIDNAALFGGLQRTTTALQLAYETTIEGWARALDLRDRETEGHSQRVAEMAVRLARALGVEEADLVHLRRGALLHDIGKMAVPDAILLKPGPLMEEEWRVMRRHPALAYEMLAPIGYLRPALDIPYGHHEKWDGSGYPQGLAGPAIPLAARIFAVVDVYDALTSARPYRAAWPAEQTRAHIAALAGSHFDPVAVAAFLALEGSAGEAGA